MVQVNLKEYYPELYHRDYILMIPNEVASAIIQFNRQEAAYRRKKYYHKANYTLNSGGEVGYTPESPEKIPSEICEYKELIGQLHRALKDLPPKQAKRVHAYYMEGQTLKQIAQSENVSITSVWESIQHGLLRMKKTLRNFI